MKASRLPVIIRALLYGLCAVMVALCLYPVSTRLTRAGIIFCAALIWAGLLCMVWRNRKPRYALIGLTGLLFLFIMMPDRPTHVDRLRAEYLAALRRYEGTTYWWGGENAIGIDCSGLVRKALVIADIKRGFLSLDGALVRKGLCLWWHDCTARTLGHGYGDRTHLLFEATSLNELDHAPLLPGDLAVTSGGVHVLSYLGGRAWIQADAAAAKVSIAHAPNNEASYYNVPVKLMRWRQLSHDRRAK